MSDEALKAQAAALHETLKTRGVEAAIAAVAGEPRERDLLFRAAIRTLAFGQWTPDEARTYLDAMIALGDAAIASALAAGLVDEANVNAYNMAANLCDCWGDSFVRSRRHFEKGLAYAEAALTWRRQLGKGPGPFAIAYWAKGKHLLSLSRFADAADAFAASANNQTEASGRLLAQGFLGLARLMGGDAHGADALASARAALEPGLRDQLDQSLKMLAAGPA